jgi:flagellar hook-associated protein 1 FlgK
MPDIGATGVNAASQALETISNNTANINTPGYNVESVRQSQLPGDFNGAGQGVAVNSIQRAFSQFVFSQLVGAGSANQAAQVAQTNAQTLASMFPSAGRRRVLGRGEI